MRNIKSIAFAVWTCVWVLIALSAFFSSLIEGLCQSILPVYWGDTGGHVLRARFFVLVAIATAFIPTFICYVYLPIKRYMWLVGKERVAKKARQRIEHGICPRCGYNICMTPIRCPECGTNMREYKEDLDEFVRNG